MSAIHGGLGVHSMWGFSPSMNLLGFSRSAVKSQKRTDEDHAKDSGKEGKEEQGKLPPLNILLVQPSDPRHIIHTIAQRNRKSKRGPSLSSSSSSHPDSKNRPINIYILEEQAEILSRHLLLLHIFLDNIQIRHRAALFLEVFGNTLVQKRTEQYIADTASLLRELIYSKYDGADNNGGNDKYNNRFLRNMIDFNHLKQRELDEIDQVFKSWSIENEFDIESYRDYRLRGYYGDRYDCRLNLIDWDYHARAKDVASIIHRKQFQEWRMSGIAFEFGDATYSSPNRSMSSYNKGRTKNGRDWGMHKEIQGFWLDILVSPYIAFGVEIDFPSSSDSITNKAEQLFDVVNKGSGAEQHRHHTVDVAMYNLLSFMWEIETNQHYEMKKERDIFSGLGQELESSQIPSDESPSRNKESTMKIELLDENNEETNIHEESVKEMSNKAATTNSPVEPAANNSIGRDECIEKSIDGINIILLKGDLKTIASKRKYKNKFHQVHLSQHAAHNLGESYLRDVVETDFEDELRGDGISSTITIETGKFIFPLQKKEHVKLSSKIVEMGETSGFVPITANDNFDDSMNQMENLNILSFKTH